MRKMKEKLAEEKKSEIEKNTREGLMMTKRETDEMVTDLRRSSEIFYYKKKQIRSCKFISMDKKRV